MKYVMMIIGLFAVLELAACSPSLSAGGEDVTVSKHAPASKCYYLGTIKRTNGNTVTGSITSTDKLRSGVLNELQNTAVERNANYIQLTKVEQHKTKLVDRMVVTSISMTGKLYKCGG